jgi:hypothetical protein
MLQAADLWKFHGGTVRIKQADIIPVILAFSAAGPNVAPLAAPAAAAPAAGVIEQAQQGNRRRKKDGPMVTTQRERWEVLALVIRCMIEVLQLIADLSGWAGGRPGHLL